jgi:quinol monooxygenase YgiN
MSEHVFWILEMNIKDGAYDDLQALMAEMIAATRQEPGCINYEWFINEDRTRCHLYERYADSAAVLVHLGNFGKHFAKRFMALLQPTRYVVYGPASDEVRRALDGMGAEYMTLLDGFMKT